jgi:hypothetical protein
MKNDVIKKEAYDGGPADTYPGQDAVHPYSYPTEPTNPNCPHCQKKMVSVTKPYSPEIVFSCPDCSFKTNQNRMEPGTGNSESGAEHIQNFEGLVDKSAFMADQPFPLTIHNEWEVKRKMAELVYGMGYWRLTVGQKERLDIAYRTFWDNHF